MSVLKPLNSDNEFFYYFLRFACIYFVATTQFRWMMIRCGRLFVIGLNVTKSNDKLKLLLSDTTPAVASVFVQMKNNWNYLIASDSVRWVNNTSFICPLISNLPHRIDACRSTIDRALHFILSFNASHLRWPTLLLGWLQRSLLFL